MREGDFGNTLSSECISCGLMEWGAQGTGLSGQWQLNTPFTLLPGVRTSRATCLLTAPAWGTWSQMYSATADVSSIWKKEGEDDDLKNEEATQTDLTLKPQSMSVVGLCLDIPLIKKDRAKKRPRAFQQQLNLEHVGFVRRISALPPSAVARHWAAPHSVRAAPVDKQPCL